MGSMYNYTVVVGYNVLVGRVPVV